MCPNINGEKIHVKDPVYVQKRILESATKNFAKNGYVKTSLSSIAESAKVSKGGVYHHFQSKEELFTAVLFQSVNLSEKTNSNLFQNKDHIVKDLRENYDKVIDGPLNLAKNWIEGISESMHNPKLRKLLNQAWGKPSKLQYLDFRKYEKV